MICLTDNQIGQRDLEALGNECFFMAKMGRPTKYEPKFVQQVEEYLKTCGRDQTKLPKRVDIAMLLEVDEDTLNNWAKKHKDFFGALSHVDQKQKSTLIDDSFYGGREINANVGMFLLEANHGMIRTERKMLVGEEGKEINVKVIEDKKNE
jgi:hypothetical protein